MRVPNHLRIGRALLCHAICMLLGVSSPAFGQATDARLNGVELHLDLGPVVTLADEPLRRVPRSEGGSRFVQLENGPGIQAGAVIVPHSIPAEARLSVTTSFDTFLQQQEHRTVSCGSNCTRTESFYVRAGDVRATTLALDMVLKPWRGSRLRPDIGIGIGRRHLAYNEARLSDEVRDYFTGADAMTLFRLSAALVYSLRRGVSASVGVVRQTTSNSSRPPEDGEIWPQKDVAINARLRIRVH